MQGPRRLVDSPSGRRLGRWILLPGLLALGAAVAWVGRSPQGPGLDADLCPEPLARLAGRTVALFDLRKPLDEDRRGLPAAVLRRIAAAMPPAVELRVFALAGRLEEPRLPLGRLCKPAAAGAGDACAAPSAEDAPRPSATAGYCARREALAARLDRLPAASADAPVTDAYLVEALEDTRGELAAASGTLRLYVLSDMLQHASWYSQLELPAAEWTIERYDPLREARAALIGASPAPDPANLETILVYIPRRGLTTDAGPARAHRAFWTSWFAGAARFDLQAAMDGYAFEPRMQPAAEASAAADESARLQARRERLRELGERLDQRTAALSETRERATAEGREIEARAEEQRRTRRRIAELRAESDRLRTELGRPADGPGPRSRQGLAP